jgi:hypothetical protein
MQLTPPGPAEANFVRLVSPSSTKIASGIKTAYCTLYIFYQDKRTEPSQEKNRKNSELGINSSFFLLHLHSYLFLFLVSPAFIATPNLKSF